MNSSPTLIDNDLLDQNRNMIAIVLPLDCYDAPYGRDHIFCFSGIQEHLEGEVHMRKHNGLNTAATSVLHPIQNKRINYVSFSKEDENIMLPCIPELITILSGQAGASSMGM